MAKKILIARHGETGPDYYAKFIGATDVAIGPKGPGQARGLAKAIKPLAPSAFFCSPLLRTRQTADIICTETHLAAPGIEDDLREINFGRWEGKSFAEISKLDPELVKQWSVWSPEFTFPEGDKVSDFLARVHGVADRLVNLDAECILIITHGGVLRAMLCHLLGLAARHYLLFNAKPARLTVIDMFDQGGILAGFNI